MASQGLISADSGKPTGAETPADALEAIQRMSPSDAENQESYECTECGDTFSTERGRDSHVEQVHGRPYHDEDTLRELYVERGLSSMDIADRFGVSYAAITDSLRRNGIEVRSTKATHRQKAPAELRDADELRRLYHDEELSDGDIADRLGVTQSTVTVWRQRHEIESRDPPTGEDHWRWSDSTESIYYGENWHRQSRRARERDDHTCQICEYEPDDDERQLDVHHIKPVRTFDEPEDANDLENLITLCRLCHRKWEGIPLRPQ
jgi:5-methylcytosine-specific restriction endonuclease McrA/predicted transcriptional regulator